MDNPRNIKIEDYNYELPGERIALHPLAVRDACKLLCYKDGNIADHVFSELPVLLPVGALMVRNDTRVINARLRFSKTTGAAIEIFCLEPHEPADYALAFATRGRCMWQCLVGNAKKWKEGSLCMEVDTASGHTTLHATQAPLPPAADKSRTIIFEWNNTDVPFSDIISAVGEIPIPPYLNRPSEAADSTDYQTVYSRIDGSVAAPTAGLHFTPELLARLPEQGVEVRSVTLHVGAGTFRPVKSDVIADHDMHSEFIAVEASLIDELAQSVGHRPIVAVGTTSVRTLESLYHAGRLIMAGQWSGEVPQWSPYDPELPDISAAEALRALSEHLAASGADMFTAHTRIIIAPGYDYRIVDAMITNFHQPASTLLLLVSAFIGDAWRNVYNHALAAGYRFLSYGDACLFFRKQLCN